MRKSFVGMVSAALIVLTACGGGDDGASVRNLGGACPSGAASASPGASPSHASGSASATGTHASGSASGSGSASATEC